MLESKLQSVRENIQQACARVGRDSAGVTLVVVTKTVGTEIIGKLLSLGVRDIGENRVQDAAAKAGTVRSMPDCRFHMIGHLQRNKARQAVQLFHLIHSIDSVRLAQAVNNAADTGDVLKKIPVLLEVNISGEESKHGFTPESAAEAAPEIIALPHLDLQGLMTMAPFDAGEPMLRKVFSDLRALKERIECETGANLPHLSMGMSDDYEIAVEEGATIVRVGTAIVG